METVQVSEVGEPEARMFGYGPINISRTKVGNRLTDINLSASRLHPVTTDR
jgi:hypothetical protein